MNWNEMPMWMRVVLLATLAVMACQAVLANAQGEPEALEPPEQYCSAYTLPADRSACFDQYTAERLYDQQIDPSRAMISTAFPVLAVVASAFLGLKLAGL